MPYHTLPGMCDSFVWLLPRKRMSLPSGFCLSCDILQVPLSFRIERQQKEKWVETIREYEGANIQTQLLLCFILCLYMSITISPDACGNDRPSKMSLSNHHNIRQFTDKVWIAAHNHYSNTTYLLRLVPTAWQRCYEGIEIKHQYANTSTKSECYSVPSK